MNDDKFQTVLSDVVWRFHVYEQYGQKAEKAIRAFTRRAPGYALEFYREQFELNRGLLVTTIEAVNEAPKHHRPELLYSEYSDVDTDYVMYKLRAAFPGQPDEFLKDHLGMVIYWYYLR